MQTIEEKKEQFEYWLFDMDNVLEEFISKYQSESLLLDYSIASLDGVENLILKSFDTIEELKKKEYSHFYDELSRYVGETFRKNEGGKWKLDIERESNAYYNLPILDYPTPVCPHRLVTACIDRRTGVFFSTILANILKS